MTRTIPAAKSAIVTCCAGVLTASSVQLRSVAWRAPETASRLPPTTAEPAANRRRAVVMDLLIIAVSFGR
jgi:hypothetical protein